eukprot:8051198-Karenia_brevis.AAC.1
MATPFSSISNTFRSVMGELREFGEMAKVGQALANHVDIMGPSMLPPSQSNEVPTTQQNIDLVQKLDAVADKMLKASSNGQS